PDLTRAFLTPQVLHHEGGTGETDGAEPAPSVHYGFGLEFELLADGSVRSAYKDGINTGASAILRHYPDPVAAGDGADALPPAGAPGVTVVVLSNSEAGAWDPIRRLDEIVRG
ncbi:MAG: hypothetical protein ACTINV_16105, partial [Cellulosimicrobium funkei]